MEEAELRGFAGAVDSFDDEQPSGKWVMTVVPKGRDCGLRGEKDFERTDANA